MPGHLSATLVYKWNTASGPALSASFQVPDAAVADGVINASEISSSSGFTASASVGTFTNLTADSALEVDPLSGAVVRLSSSSLVATNPVDTLLLGTIGYLIPTSPLQSRGTGAWKVTHLTEVTAPLQLDFLGFTNAQAQLLVTSGSIGTITVEASPDLAQWKPIVTNVIPAGSSIVTDPEPAVSPARFYRAFIRN